MFFSLRRVEDLTRSYIQKLIAGRLASVNQAPVGASYRVKPGTWWNCRYLSRRTGAKGRAHPLDIYYEDSDVIVVNKPRGMVVHPAEGNYTGTLVHALLYHCKDLSGINGVTRPGIVHRLDKDTSGLIVAAKNDFAWTWPGGLRTGLLPGVIMPWCMAGSRSRAAP